MLLRPSGNTVSTAAALAAVEATLITSDCYGPPPIWQRASLPPRPFIPEPLMLHWLFSGWMTWLYRFEFNVDIDLTGLDAPGWRAIAAGLVALACVLAAGPATIHWLAARFRTRIRRDSQRLAEMHQHKSATPSLGGVLILAGLLTGALLLADLTQPLPWAILLITLGMGAIGAVDDLLKVTTGGKGLPARIKLYAQVVIALVGAGVLQRILLASGEPLALTLPGVGWSYELGWWFVPCAVLAMVGSANAVNLTDGLDGLAGGCVVFTAAALAVAASATATLAPAAGEAVVVLGALTGAVLGFLWFNCAPARVFMGDTGSLAIGGLLGAAAVALRQELLLAILGGVFVAETVSVILQVLGFRLTRQRLFACAPLHHHFQFKGWGETQIVTRFWLASLACATLGIALAARDPGARTPAEGPLSIAESARGRETPWVVRASGPAGRTLK